MCTMQHVGWCGQSVRGWIASWVISQVARLWEQCHSLQSFPLSLASDASLGNLLFLTYKQIVDANFSLIQCLLLREFIRLSSANPFIVKLTHSVSQLSFKGEVIKIQHRADGVSKIARGLSTNWTNASSSADLSHSISGANCVISNKFVLYCSGRSLWWPQFHDHTLNSLDNMVISRLY